MYELSIISIIALCLVSFIGIPHGSFDGAVAALLGYKSKKQFIFFIVGYLVISLAVIIFWIYFSIISLVLFVGMSVIHFGLCDWSFLKINKYKWIISFTHGMNIIFGVIFFHTKEAFEIFSFLSNNNIIIFKNYLFIPYAVYGLLILIYCNLSIKIKKLRWGILEMLIILLTVSQVDPLAGFAFYFCFIHTIKHVREILKSTTKYLSNKNFVLTTTIFFTVFTWVGGCIAIIYLNNNFSFSESFIKTIFIGIAALTLPHMTLIDFFYRKKFN
tara:strand:- start:774 stop:1589 length:816 start_codon:yes stop_codon:yes gene_type:complete